MTVRDFLALSPRTFEAAKSPLEADDWLRDINILLSTAKVLEEDKVLFTTLLLKGQATAWWENRQRI